MIRAIPLISSTLRFPPPVLGVVTAATPPVVEDEDVEGELELLIPETPPVGVVVVVEVTVIGTVVVEVLVTVVVADTVPVDVVVVGTVCVDVVVVFAVDVVVVL